MLIQSPWYHSSHPSQPLEGIGIGQLENMLIITDLNLHHEPGTIATATDAVGLVVLFHYSRDFAFSFRKIELLRDFFFLKNQR